MNRKQLVTRVVALMLALAMIISMVAGAMAYTA